MVLKIRKNFWKFSILHCKKEGRVGVQSLNCNSVFWKTFFERYWIKKIKLKRGLYFFKFLGKIFSRKLFQKQPAVSRNFWIKYRILWSDWGKEMCWIDSWKYFARPPGWGARSLKDFIKYSWLLREMSFHVKDLDLWKSAVHPSPKSPSSNNLRIFFSLMTFDALLWSSILEVCQENFWYCRWAIWSRKKKRSRTSRRWIVSSTVLESSPSIFLHWCSTLLLNQVLLEMYQQTLLAWWNGMGGARKVSWIDLMTPCWWERGGGWNKIRPVVYKRVRRDRLSIC